MNIDMDMYMDIKRYCSRRGVTYNENGGEMLFRSRIPFEPAFKGYQKESKAVNKCCDDVIKFLLNKWKDEFNDVYIIRNYCGGIHGEYHVVVKHRYRHNIDASAHENTLIRDIRHSIDECIESYNEIISSGN